MQNKSNAGGVSNVFVTPFGMLCCGFCRKLLVDVNGDGEFPDVCPVCGGMLDYGVLDELKAGEQQ